MKRGVVYSYQGWWL